MCLGLIHATPNGVHKASLGDRVAKYTLTILDETKEDLRPCVGCGLNEPQGSYTKCRKTPIQYYRIDDGTATALIGTAAADEPLDLLIVADAPTRADNQKGKFFEDSLGASLMKRFKDLGVKTFALIPAVRCYPGDQIDPFVMTKKYKGSQVKKYETARDRANDAVKTCKIYVERITAGRKPQMVLAMGPLAAAALGESRGIPALRVNRLHPWPGFVSGAQAREGIVYTYDRFLANEDMDQNALRSLYNDIETLKRIRETGYGSPNGYGDHRNIEVITLDTVALVRQFVDYAMSDALEADDWLAMDYETRNLFCSAEQNRILNVGFSTTRDPYRAFVVPYQHPGTPFDGVELEAVKKELTRLFRGVGARFGGFLAHNAVFEVEMTKLFFDVWLGEEGEVPIYDTQNLAYQLDENRTGMMEHPYALEGLAREFLDFRWYADTGIKSKRENLSDLPIEEVNQYVGYDAAVTARLCNVLLDCAADEGSLYDIVRLSTKLYSPAIIYVTDMRMSGQLVNVDLLMKLRAPDSAIKTRIVEIEQWFQDQPEVKLALKIVNANSGAKSGMSLIDTGVERFDLASHHHRRALFWDVLKLEGADTSVDKAFQTRHINNKIVSTYTEYQQLIKLDTSYLAPVARYLQSPNSADGRLRPSFILTGTKTGRLGCRNPNCYDDKTEILTRRGWVKFEDLTSQDTVAQWWPHGAIDFVLPSEITKQTYVGPMTKLLNQHIDLVVTPHHRCPVMTRRSGRLKVFEAQEFPADHKQFHAGVYAGGDVSLTEAEVTWICAAQADGSWRTDVKSGAMEFTLTKIRKIVRLRSALDALGAKYTEHPKAPNRVRFYVQSCPTLKWAYQTIGPKKEFTSEWLLSLSRATLDLFVLEINHWDGCFTRNNQYTSTLKENADLIQVAMTLSNIRATVNPHSVCSVERGTHDWANAWVIYQTPRNYSMTTNVEKTNVPYEGKVYCVTVPSTFVVVRRNGIVCISGNTQQNPRGESLAGKQIKSLTKAPDGYVLVASDYSQAEVRWMGAIAGDKTLAKKYQHVIDIKKQLLVDPTNNDLLKALKIDGDIHQSTAITMFNLNPDIVFTDPKHAKLLRQRCKAVTFGVLFGKTVSVLAKDLGLTLEEMTEVYDKWMLQFTEAGEWLHAIEALAKDNGYVKSPFGRWRRLPESRSSNQGAANRAKRQARNTPIQSASSDCMIYGASKIRKQLMAHKNIDVRAAKIVNTVHDSLVVEIKACPTAIMEYMGLARSVLTDSDLLMEDFNFHVTVPMEVDFDLGADAGNMRDIIQTKESIDRALWDASVLRLQPAGTIFDDLKGRGLLWDEVMK